MSEVETSVVVESVDHIAADVVELSLVAADGSPLPPWTPGAHIDLIMDADNVRQYSLCGPGQTERYQVSVLLAPDSRGGSRRVHSLTPGEVISIRGPPNPPISRSPPPRPTSSLPAASASPRCSP